MREAAWWYWAGLALFTVLPIASTLLGAGLVNVLTIGTLLIVWGVWPSVGALIYTATWVNLVGYRLFHTIHAGGGRIRLVFPLTVNNQNGSSSWLMILGALGAIRSGFDHDGVGIALGIVGAAVLFVSQGPLFQPVGVFGPAMLEAYTERYTQYAAATTQAGQAVLPFPEWLEAQARAMQALRDAPKMPDGADWPATATDEEHIARLARLNEHPYWAWAAAQRPSPGVSSSDGGGPKPAPPEGRPSSVRCWSCRTKLAVDAFNAGARVKCPGCGTKQVLPN